MMRREEKVHPDHWGFGAVGVVLYVAYAWAWAKIFAVIVSKL